IQATNRGPRTSTCLVVLVLDTVLLLAASVAREGEARHNGCSERGARERCYSATTTTTATRGAAQINWAALSEQKLNAGGHVAQLTQ
ncbi:MAG: hypothetical protein J2P17_35010, partial [Mycobacterium sp.]|nr:hypothetical protein [Mycobacterium sp.]